MRTLLVLLAFGFCHGLKKVGMWHLSEAGDLLLERSTIDIGSVAHKIKGEIDERASSNRYNDADEGEEFFDDEFWALVDAGKDTPRKIVSSTSASAPQRTWIASILYPLTQLGEAKDWSMWAPFLARMLYFAEEPI